MHHPNVLFLDEPTLGLDRYIWQYIKEMNRQENVTVVLTTHYMDEADFLCNRVAIIDNGKIVALDTPKNLKDMIGADTITLEASIGGETLLGSLQASGGAGMSGLPKGVDYISFLTPGIIGMTLLFSATFTGLSVLWDREFGFLKEIMVAPVSRLAIILGRTAGGATTAIFQSMIILISGIVMGMRVQGLGGFILSFVFMVLIAATFIGMGLAFASKMKDMSGFSLIMNFLIFPLFFLSGAIFPLERFPIAVRTIAYIDPLTYGVDGLRYCFLGASFMSPVLDLMVLTASCLAMLGLGAYLFETSDVD